MRDILMALDAMRDTYSLHKFVYDTLLPPGSPRTFLFSPVLAGSRPAVLIRGEIGGDLAAHGKPLALPEDGTECLFTLRANPTVTNNGKIAQIARRPEKDSLRLRWLNNRAAEHGFEVLDVAMNTVPDTIDKKPAPIHLNVTTYTGRLRVTRSAAFAQALQAGIGRSRAWACGLLIANPA